MSLSVSAGTGSRVSGTLMPLAARNFEPDRAAGRPAPAERRDHGNDLAADPAVSRSRSSHRSAGAVRKPRQECIRSTAHRRDLRD